MQKKKVQIPVKQILLFLVIVLMTGCRKHEIKKHYTGDFLFTAIKKEYENYVPVLGGDDTIVAVGKITWLEDKNINITFSQYSYNVTVNNDDRFSLTDPIYYPDPRNKETVEGKFINADEVEFTYTYTHAYIVLFTCQIVVNAKRM